MLQSTIPGPVTTVLRSTAELWRLRPQWEALFRRCRATPFQSPAWLLPWWRHFGSSDLRAVCRSLNGDLVALAPLYVYTEPVTAERKLFFLGMGNSDLLGPLVAPEDTYASLADEIALAGRDCDSVELRHLYDPSTLAGPHVPTEEDDAHPVLELPHTVEEFEQSLAHSFRERLAYAERRASREGLSVEAAGESTLLEITAALLHLHQSRWAAAGLPGVLGAAQAQNFHRDAIGELFRSRLLRMYAVRTRDEIIAVYYGMHHQDRSYYYLGGFHPAYKHLSPGHLVVGHAIREAIREGAREFDFLRGRELYKYEWGARDRGTLRIQWHAAARPRRAA